MDNPYLKNNVAAIHRASIMDVMIYVFIDTQRLTIASISIEESAKAFMHHHKISEEDYSLAGILQSYLRMRKKLIDEQKTDHGRKKK